MTIIKTLLTGLGAVALSVSIASAQEGSRDKKPAEAMSKRATLTIKPITDSQVTAKKSAIGAVVKTDLAVATPTPHLRHSEINTQACYAQFGNPPVYYVLGTAMPIDCNYYIID
ncbi:hypothetical protein M0N77_02745 [Psychrobacter sp. AH5]|uniref:hypothetical protein n=1 Tax=Psychrobacter sp. AH5 TaxID=2937433 RepID=UPI00333FCA6F